MRLDNANRDDAELRHFSAQADTWWDKNGPLKTLHDINPARIHFIEQYAALDGVRVCDIGCGGGILAEGMALHGAQVTGIDLACELLEQAKQHAALTQLSIDYQCISAESFAQENLGAFDLVTCMEMLEHVPDPQAIMQAATALLKPNGWLFVSTLNKTLKAKVLGVWAAEYILNLVPKGTHDAGKFIAPHQLVAWARSLNLSVSAITGLHYNPLTRQTQLHLPADINYLLAFQKQA